MADYVACPIHGTPSIPIPAPGDPTRTVYHCDLPGAVHRWWPVDLCSCGCGCEPDGDWHWSQQPWCPCVRQGCPCVVDKPGEPAPAGNPG